MHVVCMRAVVPRHTDAAARRHRIARTSHRQRSLTRGAPDTGAGVAWPREPDNAAQRPPLRIGRLGKTFFE